MIGTQKSFSIFLINENHVLNRNTFHLSFIPTRVSAVLRKVLKPKTYQTDLLKTWDAGGGGGNGGKQRVKKISTA